jgi:hypothetical protein
MHGIIAMSRELQDLIEPSANVNDAIDIISCMAFPFFSSNFELWPFCSRHVGA